VRSRRRFSSCKFWCNFFWIIPVVDITNGTNGFKSPYSYWLFFQVSFLWILLIVLMVFSRHILIGSSFKPVFFFFFFFFFFFWVSRWWCYEDCDCRELLHFVASLMVLSTINISGLLSGTVRSVIMDLSHSWSSVTRIVAHIWNTPLAVRLTAHIW